MNVKKFTARFKKCQDFPGAEILVYLFSGPALISPVNCGGSLQQNRQGPAKGHRVFPCADVPCAAPSPFQEENALASPWEAL